MIARARRLVDALWLACCGVTIASCSLLIDPESASVKCEVRRGVDPCPAGQRCTGGVCVAATCEDEVCGDDRDNDCDGKIDEGFDLDGDGVKRCGANPEEIDCDDRDPRSFPAVAGMPAATEICDDRDNDCDGMRDETGPTLCQGTQSCVRGACVEPGTCTSAADCAVMGPNYVCELTGGQRRCVMQTMTGCATNPGSCMSDEFCAASGTCVKLKAIGVSCADDRECLTHACFPGLDSMSVCSKTCCADADCPSGTGCWSPGTGARGCVPRERIPAGITSCTRNATCGSGPSANVCAVRSVGGVTATSCGNVGSVAEGESCMNNAECKSGLCAGVIPFFGGFCTSVCGSDADCDAISRCQFARLGSNGYPVCVALGDGDHTGTACAGSESCSGFCGPTGVCGDLCCSDADCTGGFHCRPTQRGTSYPMFCQP